MAGNRVKPAKPWDKFPLTANGNGQWSKKIKGHVHYFGVWEDPTAALEQYYREKPFLEAGDEPPGEIFTVAELVASFLREKEGFVRTREVKPETLRDYRVVCKVIRDRFGRRDVSSLSRADYANLRVLLAEGYSKRSLKQRLTIARMIFKHGKIETANLHSPAKRLIRAETKIRLFTAGQVRHMLDHATGELLDMVLLGINCAFGPTDCLTLTPDRVNCEWIEHPRSKTGVNRRCPLWPETRPQLPFTLSRAEITEQFRELVKPFYTPNVTTFYTLRRTFETIATTADVPQAVIDSIMGHVRDDMASIYRQKVFDQQLRKCVDHVRDWTFGNITLE